MACEVTTLYVAQIWILALAIVGVFFGGYWLGRHDERVGDV